jgi:hypothetical protein
VRRFFEGESGTQRAGLGAGRSRCLGCDTGATESAGFEELDGSVRPRLLSLLDGRGQEGPGGAMRGDLGIGLAGLVCLGGRGQEGAGGAMRGDLGVGLAGLVCSVGVSLLGWRGLVGAKGAMRGGSGSAAALRA